MHTLRRLLYVSAATAAGLGLLGWRILRNSGTPPEDGDRATVYNFPYGVEPKNDQTITHAGGIDWARVPGRAC